MALLTIGSQLWLDASSKLSGQQVQGPQVSAVSYHVCTQTGCAPSQADARRAQVFAKCGIIKEDEDRAPRVKLYKDPATGLPKGDGRVTYLKEPSVRLMPHLLYSTCTAMHRPCSVLLAPSRTPPSTTAEPAAACPSLVVQ